MPPNLSKWLRCTKCPLHKTRRKVVLGRGVMPAELLIIGEAPGTTEDLFGEPFVGPAGRILNLALEEAALKAKREIPTFYITNVVACKPTDIKRGPFREPNPLEILRCSPRIRETFALVKPRVILLLGNIAQRTLRTQFPDAIKLFHPSYIRRKGGTRCSEYRHFVRELVDIFRDLKRTRKLFTEGRK